MLALCAAAGCSEQSNGNSSKPVPPATAVPPAIAPPAPAPPVAVAVAKPESATTTKRHARPAIVVPPLAPPFSLSTLSGVYSANDAREGRDLYLGYCVSCHSAATHTGPAFRLKWAGRPLSDLFSYMHTNMPKNDPASLDDYQYGVLLAYILQMNKMPAGKAALSPDSADLAKIRIDTIQTRKP